MTKSFSLIVHLQINQLTDNTIFLLGKTGNRSLVYLNNFLITVSFWQSKIMFLNV